MLKKIAIALGAIFLLVVLFFCFAFFGNPVSEMLVTKSAEKYIQENYPDENYGIDHVAYDFKTSDYYVEVVSPDGVDRHFTLYGGLDGKITFDTYKSAVADKWNTAGRINDEYRNSVDKAFESKKLPYITHISFGDIQFADNDYAQDESVPDYAIPTDLLTLDGEYDIYEMGKKAGCLTVYVYDDTVSAEKLSEILLAVKELMDKENVGFKAINCVLEFPKPEDDGPWKEGREEVMNFLYEDITSDGLAERVKASSEEASEYYAKLDAQK